MNVLVWATTFGADLWSLTRYLDEHPDVTVRVVLSDPEVFQREPVNRLLPIKAELIRRRRRHNLLGVSAFEADVTIMDNRVPLRAKSPTGFVLWHGFGWKGPNDEKEFAWLHNSIARNWGSANWALNRLPSPPPSSNPPSTTMRDSVGLPRRRAKRWIRGTSARVAANHSATRPTVARRMAAILTTRMGVRPVSRAPQ